MTTMTPAFAQNLSPDVLIRQPATTMQTLALNASGCANTPRWVLATAMATSWMLWVCVVAIVLWTSTKMAFATPKSRWWSHGMRMGHLLERGQHGMRALGPTIPRRLRRLQRSEPVLFQFGQLVKRRGGGLAELPWCLWPNRRLCGLRKCCQCTVGCGDPVSYQGYDYATVLIGDQCWFAENLRNESYRNGDAIPTGLSDNEWSSTTSGAVAIYGEDANCSEYSPDIDACDPAQSLSEYGRLYNWYAVDEARGLCPSGWHVPTDGEWTVLTDFLGGTSAAVGQMKTDYGWLNGATARIRATFRVCRAATAKAVDTSTPVEPPGLVEFFAQWIQRMEPTPGLQLRQCLQRLLRSANGLFRPLHQKR